MNAASVPELSIVIPVLDEAATIETLHSKLREEFGDEVEVLFVDDGSTDGSSSILGRLAREHSLTRVLSFRRNHGKSQALAVGFSRARGRSIATLDGDLQDDPKELRKLVEGVGDGYDVVGGFRRQRRDSLLKVLNSRIFNRLVSLVSGKRFRDVNCGMKAFRREVLEDLVLDGGFHRFLPVLAMWRGFRVTEVEIEHHPRHSGKSRYGRGRGFRGLVDLGVIFFLMRFGGRPGRFFLVLGSLFGAGGLGISAFVAWLRVAHGSIQSRFPLMALGLALLVIGFQLFTLGLFGELLAYHFRSLKSAQPLVLEEGGES